MQEARISWPEQGCRLLLDDGVEAALVENEVVLVAELVVSEVLACDAEDEGALFGRVGALSVCIVRIRSK